MSLTPTAAVALPWRGGVIRSGPAPLVMGILNVTPDSFSDGGRYAAPAAAVARARVMVEQGADVIDVGGESSRPGAEPVSAAAEIARVAPVIEAIRGLGLPVSVDTTKAAVAHAALEAGADWINDITALEGDPEMASLVAERGCPVVLMHMRGTPRTMQRDTGYDDVVHEVLDYLLERVEVARSAGIERGRMLIDPGIGFGKAPRHNLALLRAVPEFVRTGQPVLIGASRKSFLGACFGQPPGARLEGSLAAALAAVAGGAQVVRVHDVAATRRAVDVFAGIAAADGGREGAE
jgi:dihydropteroate synthase